MSPPILDRVRSVLAAGDDGTPEIRPDGGGIGAEPSSGVAAGNPSRTGGAAVDDSTSGTSAGGSEGVGPMTDGGDDGFHVSPHVLFGAVSQAAFVIDTDGSIKAWNRGMEELTGIDADEALDRSDIGTLLYESADETMIEQVLAAPKTADEEYGLTVSDPSRHLYVKEDRVADHSGNVEHYARITVMPIYEDGELQGAVEMVQDLTDERQRQEETEALVDEVSGTLQSLTDGNLAARASFSDSDAIDSQLLGVVDEVNEMAENLQDIVARVDQQADQLGESVEHAVSAADEIARNVDDQNGLLVESVDEMHTFSASMEEVAATAEEVDANAKTAREAANEGLDASEDARAATDEVTDIGEDLVESVTDLGDRMADIENVVEVISEVAEQTNMLALNANIEAARAGEDGDGFAVVADEVKTLADETREHTEEITRDIDRLRSQTGSTVDAAEESHQQIATASDQIDDVLEAFEDIATAIDEAADGIADVSRATDDQAATVEELTSTLETAREHAADTEGAVDNIVTATDEQADAIAELEARVQQLRGERSAARPT